MNIYISVIINVALCIVLPLVATHHLDFPTFLKGFIIAFPVSTLIVLFIPINRFGDFIASKLGCKPRSVPFKLVSTAVLALIVGTIMSLLMMTIMAGKFTGYFTPAFFGAWVHVWPWALLCVYISALIGVFTGFPFTMKVAGPPPGMPPQGE